MCTDTALINAVVRKEGLRSVIAMAQSPHKIVQRHAARAFGYLAMNCSHKRQIVDMGGLQSLLTLSMLGEANPQATLLAEEALMKLSENETVRAEIEAESVSMGRGLNSRPSYMATMDTDFLSNLDTVNSDIDIALSDDDDP
jgi:hypothetical protein